MWSRRLRRCLEVSLYSVLGEGGSGLGLRSRGRGAALALGGAFGGADVAGAAEAARCRAGGVVSTGSGNGSTLIFRRGARSLLPGGLPRALGAACAAVGACTAVGASCTGDVEFSEFSSSFSRVLVTFSGIVASASAILKKSQKNSVDRQGEGDVGKRVDDIIVAVSELEGELLQRASWEVKEDA